MKPTPRLMALAIAFALSTTVAVDAQAQSTSMSTASVAEVRAQGSEGIVFGSVRETARGASLPGAQVSIDGRSAITGSDGSFRIGGLAPGSYTLTVDYLGYDPVSTQVQVGQQSGARVDVTLVSTVAGASTLDRIEVRATRDAQALALNQQRASTNYKNVVSSDLLGRFPDINIAESTQRIPGVSIERDQGEGRYVSVRGAPLEFTSVSVDGVQISAPNPGQRAVELDTIPPDAIAALEVTKALTPDMDGDAIAGQINLVTQSALDREDNILRGSIGLGRFELGDGDNDRANASVGGRFGANRNLGALVTVSGSRSGRFTDNVEAGFTSIGGGEFGPEFVEVKDYEGERTRLGLTARFDARIDENNLIYVIGSASRFRDEEFRNTLVIEFDQDYQPGSNEVIGIANRGTFDKELRERIQEQNIRTLNLGGEHWLGDWEANWQASYSRGEFDIPTRQQFIYRSSVRPPVRYDYSNPDFPTFTLLNPDGSPLLEGINLPEDFYAFRRYNQRFEDAVEDELALRVDLGRSQDFLGDSGQIQFGLRTRLREKESNDDRNRVNGGPAPAYSDTLCPRVSNNFGRFEFGRVFCNNVFERFGDGLRAGDFGPLVEDSIVSDYEASEDIYAGYFRLDAEWERLTMVTGLRYERTETASQAFLFDQDTEVATPRNVERNYVKFLPSLHLRYELGEDTILRTSYSTGLSRPNFPAIVPRIVFDENERDVDAGNPDLKATYSQNFDVSVEHYLRPLGLLSAALFYKRLDDPIFLAVFENSEAFGGRNVTQPANGASGRIHGAELAWQQTFDFLPGAWDGLGVYANYTYADSSAELPLGIGRTDLPGTSRHNYNAAVFYEKYGFNARLAYNYRSKYIQEFNVEEPALNVFWDDRSILDFTTSFQFNRNWQVFGEINNITDTKQRRFQGTDNRVLELEQFGRYWLVGARFEF